MINFADDFYVTQMVKIKEEFFQTVFDMQPSDYYITDESTLSDFCLSGPYELDDSLQLHDVYIQWGRLVIDKINTTYTINIVDISIPLVQMFTMIDTRTKSSTLH